MNYLLLLLTTLREKKQHNRMTKGSKSMGEGKNIQVVYLYAMVLVDVQFALHRPWQGDMANSENLTIEKLKKKTQWIIKKCYLYTRIGVQLPQSGAPLTNSHAIHRYLAHVALLFVNLPRANLYPSSEAESALCS